MTESSQTASSAMPAVDKPAALTLYGVTASRAIRPLWMAEELGLPYRHVPTPFLGGGARTQEMLQLNPNGHIPVLTDDRPEGRVVVWESMACALYLARVHGGADASGPSPVGAAEEADALRWSFWAVNELEKDALTVLMHRQAMPADQRKPDLADAAEKRLAAPLRVLEQHLNAQRANADGQRWMTGARFTVVDVCVASVVGWTKPAKTLWSSLPVTGEWLAACTSRPAHQKLRQRAKAGD
jgi:glutathione S-transferase